jgi:hypothetical protein
MSTISVACARPAPGGSSPIITASSAIAGAVILAALMTGCHPESWEAIPPGSSATGGPANITPGHGGGQSQSVSNTRAAHGNQSVVWNNTGGFLGDYTLRAPVTAFQPEPLTFASLFFIDSLTQRNRAYGIFLADGAGETLDTMTVGVAVAGNGDVRAATSHAAIESAAGIIGQASPGSYLGQWIDLRIDYYASTSTAHVRVDRLGGGSPPITAQFANVPPPTFVHAGTLCTGATEQMGMAYMDVTRGYTGPSGACCFPSGLCFELRAAECTANSGIYHGDGTFCFSTPIGGCPQPATGACCTSSGCVVLTSLACASASGVYMGDNTACAVAPCANFTWEVEPNDTKAQATHALLSPGGILVGRSTGAFTNTGGLAQSADYWRIEIPPGRAEDLRRHTLRITTPGNIGHTGTIRGLDQLQGVINFQTDRDVQTTSASAIGSFLPRTNVFYTAGSGGRAVGNNLYYRVAGASGTTANYLVEYDVQTVVPQNAGTFQAGDLIIKTGGQGHTTDTALWVFDSQLRQIPGYGNDDEPLGFDYTSTLWRHFDPGIYYIAIARHALVHNQSAPPDDLYRNSNALDFPGVILGSSTTVSTAPDLSFAITDIAATQQFPAANPDPYQVHWVRFEVMGDPVLGACCLPSGDCATGNSIDCIVLGGFFRGHGTTCASAQCSQPGACCLDFYASCQFLLPGNCSTGGVFQGGGTTCASCQPPATWFVETGDAGELLPAALSADGSGPLHAIVGTVDTASADRVDLYKINICDYQNFSASTFGGSMLDTMLALFDETGRGVTLNICAEGLPTCQARITSQFLTANGTYYLGLSLWNRYPTDGTNLIWSSAPAFWQVEYAPNGPGASSPLGGWTGTSTFGGERYRIALTGVCFVGQTCYANCDGSTAQPILNVDDFTCFINSFAAAQSLPHAQQVTHYANCDGSTVAPALNVDDFTCFINQFAQGCP